MDKFYEKLLKMKSMVPCGKKGDWAVERFEVSEKDASFHNLRCAINHNCRDIGAGRYTRLTHYGSVIMSDTPAELRDHVRFVRRAKGNVLVNGLGLGLVVEGLMLNPDVEKVTVIEISSEVIQLVGEHLKSKYNGRLSIINADAFEWKPPKGERYGAVWHDIWPTICGDYYDDVKKLRRKYARRTRNQGTWCGEEIKQAAKGFMW